MRICFALILLGCAGCGFDKPHEQLNGLVNDSTDIPVGIAKVTVNATKQAHARVLEGESPAEVVDEGMERLGMLARAYEIPKQSPIWKKIYMLVFNTAMQCDLEVEKTRYDQPDYEGWRMSCDGVPPKTLRGPVCVAGNTIPDPCGLAGYLMRGGF